MPQTQFSTLRGEIIDLNENIKKSVQEDNLTFDLLFNYLKDPTNFKLKIVFIKDHPTIR